jgi:superfamily II DNA or RNA helicase/HKD family nuclease
VDVSPGLYDQPISERLDRALEAIDPQLVLRSRLSAEEADVLLARHVAALLRRALRAQSGESEPERLLKKIRLANSLVAQLESMAPGAINPEDERLIADEELLLLARLPQPTSPAPPQAPPRPEVPLSQSALLVNGQGQPRIGTEVAKEIESADAVDLLCAFIKWHGLRVLQPELERLRNRGASLRIITTTYIGATERKALDYLVGIGAEVKISYETRTTRLHAKAWLFHRNSGFSSAYVGSSNLSRAALLDGLEWNVRIAEPEQPHLLDTFRATFDDYWDDTSFEPYNPATDGDRLDRALAAERGGPADLPIDITALDVQPWPFQREILDELEAERTIHNRWRNLVVAATGTGKTVISALDYKRLRDAGVVERLLFVAHREEILSQSRSTFRHVVRDGSFGETYVGGSRPDQWQHVFASVQSLARLDLDRLPPDHFDMIIVDEFHHAMAPMYGRLLRHVQPKVLLGLTATPERTDAQDVKVWFDGRIAVELRLWEALDRGLLCPFQYFGLHDDVDISGVTWRRGRGYDVTELTNVYTGDDARARKVAQALIDKVSSVREIRALGFCVSIAHANFMAQRFNEYGIPSLAISTETSAEDRRRSLERLRAREVNVVFAVDLFNEGIDVPEIDTVLFLRPTESATVFLQQLGRGLRHHDDKACLTVLDFIGMQNRNFRFDLRYRALTGVSRRQLERDIDSGFPYLPAGCHLELDEVSSKLVLDNVRQALRVPWRDLVAELRNLGDVSLARFLEETELEPEDLYRRRRGGWAGLRRDAGLELRTPGPNDTKLSNAIGRLTSIDDPERIAFYSSVVGSRPEALPEVIRERRLLAMLHFALWGANESLDNLLARLGDLAAEPARQSEILELLSVLEARLKRVTQPQQGDRPLHVHAHYSRDEAVAAFGHVRPAAIRQGVHYFADERADVFFVTLRKSEEHYSPTTRYNDYAQSPLLFHWESQSTTPERSVTGKRYVSHDTEGSTVHLFIRENKVEDGGLGAPPYLYAGPAHYVSHKWERPMKILWRLEHDLPGELFHVAKVAAG